MQAPSFVQVPSRHRLLGFLAQRLKQRDRELNGPSSSHSTWTALQAEEKEAAGPSWSVDSENSDLQLAGDGPKPEFIRGQQTETQPNPSEAIASTSVERRGGGALGGWLTRLTGAYSVAGARYIHCRRAMVSVEDSNTCKYDDAVGCALYSPCSCAIKHFSSGMADVAHSSILCSSQELHLCSDSAWHHGVVHEVSHAPRCH